MLSNAQNKLIYNNSYGTNLYNYGVDCIQDNDNGYFILANTANSINGNTNIHIIRTDSAGIIKWEKAIGDTSIYFSTCFERAVDRGFIITGYTNRNFLNGYDVLLIKTDSLANIQWLKTFGSSSWDFGNSVIQSKDSCFVVAGKTYGFGARDADVYIVKVNKLGDTLWTKVFGGDSTDYASSIVSTYEDSYLIGANTKSKGAGDFDAWILNLNTNGDTIWTRTYGGVKEDILYKIINTTDSAFAFCGSTRSDPAIKLETWFVRTLKSGWVDWSLPQSWSLGPEDEAYFDVTINKKNQYVLAGYTTSVGMGMKDLMFTVMGEHYDFICSATYGTLYDDYASSIGVAHDSTYFITGNSGGSQYAINSIMFFKSGDSCRLNDTIKQITSTEQDILNIKKKGVVFPNPSNAVFTLQISDLSDYEDINIEIYNSLGVLIISKNIHVIDGFISEVFDLRNYKNGIYFILAFNKNTLFYDKIILN